MSLIARTKHDIYPFISPSAALKDCAKGKMVLVTGGGKGIGKAIAMQFALAGADIIVICGRSSSSLEDTKSEIQAAAPHCMVLPIPTDITDEASVQSLFDGVPRTPDILINNAGTSSSQESIVDSEPDDWWSDWEINLKGTYLCTRAYLRALAGGPGVILNVSSSASNFLSPIMSSYGPTKMAVNRFTEFVHFEHAKQGVQCIAFHPGGVAETAMGQKSPEQFRFLLYDTKNLGAGTALYLSTPRAAFLAGRFVFSNWDMESLEGLKDQILSEDLLTSRIRFGDYLSSEMVPPTDAS